MRRLKAVRPDQTLHTSDGREIAMVSDQAGQNAMMDLWSVLSMAGGVATIATGREPTDIDGESVTTWVAIEWKNRGDAKAQPEEHGERLSEAEEDRPSVAEVLEAPDEDEPLKVDEEDLSSIPAGQR